MVVQLKFKTSWHTIYISTVETELKVAYIAIADLEPVMQYQACMHAAEHESMQGSIRIQISPFF